MQVDSKWYEIGEPGEDSPVLVTTNFSLTYFIVSVTMYSVIEDPMRLSGMAGIWRFCIV
jgi:CO dehydrogenase/acetyl-CoA synthase gamma subunit (corrinoid Fe-S protein)